MAPEKTQDGKTAANGSHRGTETILSRLSDYLSIRFDLAGRINPNLRAIKQDLMYHELVNVRRSLIGEKIYGPSRMMVAEVFLGDDDKRRKALMSPSDQTSIQVELVSHCQDERVEHTRGQIRIHDIKSFYAAIDPTLANFMDLVETWIWWDLMDAVELVRFEQKLGLITMARQGRLSEDMRKRYITLIHPPMPDAEAPHPTTITAEEIIHYEFQRLMQIREQWAYRRQGERGYMYVLKRDELPAANSNELIGRMMMKVREYDTVEAAEALGEDLVQRYAVELKIAPEKVSQELVSEYLIGQIKELQREMARQADDDAHLGPPYNYKERQLEQMDKWLADLGNQLKLQQAKPVAPAPETPAPAAPAAEV